MNIAVKKSIGVDTLPNITAIVLAAGESRRMGARNKMELIINGQELIRQTVSTILASNVNEIIVVTGYQADVVRNSLIGLPVVKVHNDDYQQGQMSSVHKGLGKIEKVCDGIMVCLGDQPLLNCDDINYLITAFNTRAHGSILVPTYKGLRGNPIILSYKHRDRILSDKSNLGCKKLIEKKPELVCAVEMENDHVITDIDSPQDYEHLTL
ncbi:MAG: nucleotidyltransferase family protein [Proteobacteria bacterium]|nr:nucleotidyltransferase family protein [Pseudomonadota bacterium]